MKETQFIGAAEDGTEGFVHSPLRVRGVRTHNLKNIDVDIPWNRITVFAGPSGSGKSSLAYDTIFAEGQRQYIESLAAYPRRFFNQLERPDLDSIEGLSPTVAIAQRSAEPNPRSIVATTAEIYDFLRLLFARVGVARCYKCGRPIQRQSSDQILKAIMGLPEGTRFILLAPVARDKRGSNAETLRSLKSHAYARVRIDGVLMELDPLPELDPSKRHNIEVVIDRLILREEVKSRLAESIAAALSKGEGLLCCMYEKERVTAESGATRSVWKDLFFSERYSCPKCGVSYSEFEPRSFSFNSPFGACPTCSGIGRVETFSQDALIGNPERTLEEGALALGKGLSTQTQTAVKRLLEDFNALDPQAYATPLSSWSDQSRHFFFFGEPKEDEGTETEFDDVDVFDVEPEAEEERETRGSYYVNADREILARLAETKRNAQLRNRNLGAKKDRRGGQNSKEPIKREDFLGLVGVLEHALAVSKSEREKKYLNSFRGIVVCDDCKGARLRREARAATIADKRISDVCAMSVSEALEWFKGLEFTELERNVAAPIVEHIIRRLETMASLRLEYLNLDRSTDSLSGGELQRTRLTTALGNGLSGVCYILDEPTTGLHPRDVDKLMGAVDSLKARGNTVVIVEHNESVIRKADRLIDFGPGAGELGGRILAQGTPNEVAKVPDSPTGRFLSGLDVVPMPAKRRRAVKTRSLVIEGAGTNNLKNITVSIPLGLLVCVTGVSGSGKSSLIRKTIVPALKKRLHESGGDVLDVTDSNDDYSFTSMRGASRIDKVIEIDQTPIGRTARSVPSTYCGLFDEIRRLFAKTPLARSEGYKAGRFSFNIAGGRCEACQGLGVQRIESPLTTDMYATCPICNGSRYDARVLKVRYKGKSIADILNATFEEASELFANHAVISRYIDSFKNVGLGYLTLGQSSTSLSGGESQRVKLATELARVDTGSTLYVLDEPTSGLHPCDVSRLLAVLQRLVDSGNTVVVIEHSLEVMRASDWIIDMGPEGGERGGYVLATGTPEEIITLDNNETARYLRQIMNR